MKKKIAFISTDWAQSEERKKNNSYGGVSYYRLVKPMEYLKKWYECEYLGADIQKLAEGKTTEQFYDYLAMKYDMIITKQIDNPQAIAALSFFCKMRGVPLIMDLDDNLYEVREDQPAYEHYKKGEQKRAFMATAVTMADAIFTSTVPLKEIVEKTNKEVFKTESPIYILPNYNDIKDFPENEGKSDEFLIGWQGSTTHNADLKIILPVLDKIMQKYSDVYLMLMGGIEEKAIQELFKDWSEESIKRLAIVGGTPSWEGYPQLLSKQAWNLGLAPLVDEPFNRSKSHIKWMEYATQKIPCLASRVYPYSMPINRQPTIVESFNGLLFGTPEEFEEKLTYLIENRETLKTIGENAYDTVKKDWQYKDHIEEWHTAIEDVFTNYKNQSQSIKKQLRKTK